MWQNRLKKRGVIKFLKSQGVAFIPAGVFLYFKSTASSKMRSRASQKAQQRRKKLKASGLRSRASAKRIKASAIRSLASKKDH
jgi:hypothetical protein